MSRNDDRFHVITGGPGSGKSTLIDALRTAGFRAATEVGREIIKQQVAIAGRALPWQDPALFAELMLSWELRAYDAFSADAGPDPIVFDRGVPDVAGYLRLVGLPVPDHVQRAVTQCRYHTRVFICPPWPEIFEQDAERKQTLEEAVRTYESLAKTYAANGYTLVEVPRVSVRERASFVINDIGM